MHIFAVLSKFRRGISEEMKGASQTRCGLQKENSVGEGFPLPPAKQKLQAKQSLRRCRASSLYTREPLGLCEHCGRPLATGGGGYNAPFAWRKSNTVGGAFHMPPLVWNFVLTTGGALQSLPCVRGGAARSAAQGLYLTETIFLFCKLQTFTIPQALPRQLLLMRSINVGGTLFGNGDQQSVHYRIDSGGRICYNENRRRCRTSRVRRLLWKIFWSATGFLRCLRFF